MSAKSPTFADVAAVLVTRDASANPHWDEIIASVSMYGEVIVHDNSKATDFKVAGRYVAAHGASRSIVYFQDDDVLLPREAHEAILASYEPGVLVSSMYDQWIEDCGYFDLAMVGLGSIQDHLLWQDAHGRYINAYHGDDRFEYDADFVYGTLTPFKRLDVGGANHILDIASAPDRLWQQDEQMEGKWRTIKRARALRKIVLTILTKNEEANIQRALDSAKHWVDRVLIIDSGSTDKTFDKINDWSARNRIPVEVLCERWQGFGRMRNRLLEEGRSRGEYMLLMDADEELIDVPGTRPELWADGYALFYDQDVTYAQPRLLASRFPFAFDDVDVHAALDTAHETFQPVAVNLEAPLIRHHGAERSYGPERIQAQIEKLTRLIENGVDLARHLFLRGKAYEGAGEWDLAARDYERRVEDWPAGDEEHYYSRFRLGTIYCEHFNRFAEGIDHLISAYFDRPARVESLRAAAFYITAVADATPYPKNDLLLVHRELYRVTHPKEG